LDGNPYAVRSSRGAGLRRLQVCEVDGGGLLRLRDGSGILIAWGCCDSLNFNVSIGQIVESVTYEGVVFA
jgi:hypothetical protein